MYTRGFKLEKRKKIIENQLDRKIKKWHSDLNILSSLPVYLGMTEEEYNLYVADCYIPKRFLEKENKVNE